MEIKLAQDNDAEIWDEVIGSSPQGTVFHSWKWLNLVEKHTRTRLYPIMALKGDAVVGILPVFHMKKFGISAVFSPPPSTDIPYLGPVIRDYEAFSQRKRESVEKEFQRSVDRFIFSELKCGYSSQILTMYHDPRPYKWADYSLQPIFDYHIDITGDINAIWQRMSGNLKSVIKRTEKNGVSVHDGSESDLIDIYHSLIRRYKEQKRPVTISQEYLTDLYKAFYPEHFRIFVAKENGETVGGIVTILFKDRVLYWVGGARPAVPNYSPNDLTQWEIMKYANAKGYSVYEEIGAGTERLSAYKSKFNPRLICRFGVKKYSSFPYRILEKGYSNGVKRVIGKLV